MTAMWETEARGSAAVQGSAAAAMMMGAALGAEGRVETLGTAAVLAAAVMAAAVAVENRNQRCAPQLVRCSRNGRPRCRAAQHCMLEMTGRMHSAGQRNALGSTAPTA